MHKETDEEVEARLFRLGVAIREWALEERLPNPTYDPENGWKLDQFAMHFEPALLKEYRDQLRQFHNPELRPSKAIRIDGEHGIEEILVEGFDPSDWLDTFARLANKVQALLLSEKFHVMGCQPYSYTAEIVPHYLLEILHPIIETSALHERGGVPASVARRYESVRVFRLKGSPGAKPGYDWRRLFERIELEGLAFDSMAKLVDFCRHNVLRISGEKPETPAADATTREAIDKLGMEKFVRAEKPGNRGPG